MLDINEIVSAENVIQFAIWVVAVLGVGRAIFKSRFFENMSGRLRHRGKESSHIAKRLRWEIQFGEEWDQKRERIRARGETPPADSAVALDEAAVEARHVQLRLTIKRSRIPALKLYFLTCSFCQSFWLSVALLLLTNLDAGALAIAVTAPTYAFSAVVLDGAIGRLLASSQPSDTPGRGPGGCPGGDCGKQYR